MRAPDDSNLRRPGPPDAARLARSVVDAASPDDAARLLAELKAVVGAGPCAAVESIAQLRTLLPVTTLQIPPSPRRVVGEAITRAKVFVLGRLRPLQRLALGPQEIFNQALVDAVVRVAASRAEALESTETSK